MPNRIAVLKARARARKDPLNKAARAPLKRQPSTCPHGTCEHSDLIHERIRDDTQKPVAESIRCTSPGCGCREIRWPDEEAT